MRIIHTSDWHLGQYFYGKSRAAEHQAFLTWLIDKATEHAVDAIVVAGDIFDTANPPSYARELYFEFIAKITSLNCQLIVLAGNHDSVAMLSESKTVLSALNTQVVTHVNSDASTNIPIYDEHQSLLGVVCAIPFIRPRDIVKSVAGQSAVEKQQQLQAAIADYYLAQYEQAKALIGDNELPIIGTGHLTTVGASTSDSVREIYIGTLDAFPADAFPPFNYLALGHIHQSQLIAKSEHMRYCGSPIALSFDEVNHQKYVNLVNGSHQSCEVERIAIPCHQPLLALKKPIDELKTAIEKNVEAMQVEQQTIWLDIEVDSQEYHQDVQQRIEQYLADLPVEVLRVRRSKTQRMAMLENQEKITLEELDINDVFEQRLALMTDQEIADDEQKQQSDRLRALYLQSVEQLQGQS